MNICLSGQCFDRALLVSITLDIVHLRLRQDIGESCLDTPGRNSLRVLFAVQQPVGLGWGHVRATEGTQMRLYASSLLFLHHFP